MSDAARVLSQLAYLSIFKEHRKSDIDIKGWLANQKYFVNPGISGNKFTLTTHDSDGLRTALANDCNRMSMAAIESISGVQREPVLHKSSGWAAIRSYYASFFAAHALLRAFGYSYSQLESEYTKKIFEVFMASNGQNGIEKLETGLYKIHINKNFTTLSFEKKKDSHKDLWQGFLDLVLQLDDDISKVSALSKHIDLAHDLLMEVKKNITKNGNRQKGNWLSELRNQVNYQHSHGAWYPYEKKTIDPQVIQAIRSSWIKSTNTFSTDYKHQDMDKFFESTAFLLSLFREVFIVCAEKIDDNDTIFRNGAIPLLHTIKAG